MSRWRIALILVALLVPAAHGQAPPHMPPVGPAPLLHVRFAGPEGLQVTVPDGSLSGRIYPAPIAVGLRPGYIYRMKLAGMAAYPGMALYPSLEVRGTLQLPPQMRAADYPAPVVFSVEEMGRALRGALITKVVYLENPVHAVPTAAPPDLPLETELRPGVDLIEQARILGRPVMIVRLGGRGFTDEEMAREFIPGTVLFPGEQALPPAACRPFVPWGCFPVYDPILGPRCPEEECLHDGGDIGLPAGFDREGRLRGVDPSDTVAAYSDSHGGRHIAVSNRICVCVPRFAVLRSEIVPLGWASILSPLGTQTVLSQSLLRVRWPSVEARESLQAEAVRVSERASVVQSQYGTLDITELRGTATVVGRFRGQEVIGTPVVHKGPPPGPLVLCKWADKQAAEVGDVVTFFLRYTNAGGQPITDVGVSDSLTGRLVYVPGSAKTDRDAVFTLQENEAGSVLLHWEVGGTLAPGQSGLISFQVRVR
jgi:uncharacterized repeat protein (TIGR01451 family)